MRELFRIAPQMGPGAYQTFAIHSPPDNGIVAACRDAGCQAWAHGWRSIVDESTDLGRGQAHYIRHQSGRTFREQKGPGESITVFIFEAYQRCFSEHRTRPEVYAVRDGDWRGNPTGRSQLHASAADWVEHFGEHQQNLAEQHQRGTY